MGAQILKMMKVVLDTNVFISALLWQKSIKEILNLARQKKIQICVSQKILTEFTKVLKYPKFSQRLKSIGKTPSEIINEFLEIIKLYSSIELKTAIIKEDPSDTKFLSCAFSCGASFIISGDKHLLSLKKFRNIPILSPQKFLKILKK